MLCGPQLIASIRQHLTTMVGETGSRRDPLENVRLVDDYLSQQQADQPRQQQNGLRAAEGLRAAQHWAACGMHSRRVAAVAVSAAVASRAIGSVGDGVGCSIRFNKTSANTRLKFVTDGVLLRGA
jgi:hypothetical protein